MSFRINSHGRKMFEHDGANSETKITACSNRNWRSYACQPIKIVLPGFQASIQIKGRPGVYDVANAARTFEQLSVPERA
jgi:hypothetical protein